MSIEALLGVEPQDRGAGRWRRPMSFSLYFFSDVRKDVTDAGKYEFMRDLTVFADRAGFEAVYIPERHFHEFGSIYANPALIASYLIPQTRRIRFRTAGVSLPLHHPAEIVEWWAMNDVLSGGRIDLGFGSGWNRADFVFAPGNYENRRRICSERIEIVRRLWRGEAVPFPGPDGAPVPVSVYPRPIQKDIAVWLLTAQNDDAFHYAGTQGYHVFTMLYGIDLEALAGKIARYRAGRAEARLDPDAGTVTLMLHTLVHEDRDVVEAAVEAPFKAYLRSALGAHVQNRVVRGTGEGPLGEGETEKMLEYAYRRYATTAALFGTVGETEQVVERARAAGVDEIACLMDFGVDYGLVKSSCPHLERLIGRYR